MYQLDPFIDDSGLIRVGGRIRRADVPRGIAHPIILPRKSYITELIVEYFHKQTAHSGKDTTLAESRSSGFWIIGGRSSVSSVIEKCVICKKLHGKLVTQKMADLPADRVTE